MTSILEKIRFDIEQAERSHNAHMEQWKREDAAREIRAQQAAENRRREDQRYADERRRDDRRFAITQAISLAAAIAALFTSMASLATIIHALGKL